MGICHLVWWIIIYNIIIHTIGHMLVWPTEAEAFHVNTLSMAMTWWYSSRRSLPPYASNCLLENDLYSKMTTPVFICLAVFKHGRMSMNGSARGMGANSIELWVLPSFVNLTSGAICKSSQGWPNPLLIEKLHSVTSAPITFLLYLYVYNNLLIKATKIVSVRRDEEKRGKILICKLEIMILQANFFGAFVSFEFPFT